MADPARSDLLTDEWELRWTDEKEVNFAVANGLFGLPWIRTYQTIDVPGGRLVNGERDRFRGGGRAARVLEHRARPDRRRAIQLRVRRVHAQVEGSSRAAPARRVGMGRAPPPLSHEAAPRRRHLARPWLRRLKVKGSRQPPRWTLLERHRRRRLCPRPACRALVCCRR